MSLLTWKDNVAKIGGVEFEVNDLAAGFFVSLRTNKGVLVKETQYRSERQARAAAEEIAEAIFGSETCYRYSTQSGELIDFAPDPPDFVPEGYVVQRGLFMPLEDNQCN